MKLLTVGNPKTAKGEGKGYLTFILHLAPANMSGYNVCPMASAGCKAACLNTAGRGGMIEGSGAMTGAQLVAAIHDGKVTNQVQAARIRKTKQYFEDRETFLKQLVKEVKSGIKLAAKHGLKPAFRLNGTSDIVWELIDVNSGTGANFCNIMGLFPNVQFYDYTKRTNRVNLPKNYHLTFSRSETNEDAAPAGMNIAVVFAGKTLPTEYKGRPVINGDETDLRFLDPKNVIVGLKAKGKGKKDTSGFVVNI